MARSTPHKITASELLTIRQAGDDYAPALGARYIRRLVSERRIPHHRVGGRVFVARSDLDQLAQDSRVVTSP